MLDTVSLGLDAAANFVKFFLVQGINSNLKSYYNGKELIRQAKKMSALKTLPKLLTQADLSGKIPRIEIFKTIREIGKVFLW